MGFAEHVLQLREDLLDRVQIRGVFRQEEELGAGLADCPPNRLSPVTPEIIHDHDVAGGEAGDQEIIDVGQEALAVDRAVEQAGRLDPVMSEGGDERHRLPATEWSFPFHPRPAGTPAAQRRHVGLRPRLVDENQSFRIDPPLILLPLLTPPGDVGPVLLLGEHAFFYS